MKKLFLPILALFLFPVFTAPAQTSCLGLLREACSRLQAQYDLSPDKNTVRYMNYTVRTVTPDSARAIPVSDIEVWAGNGQLHLRSKQMEVYQDASDVFTVLPGNKVIFRSDAGMDEEQKKKRTDRMIFLRDTLFQLSSLQQCNIIKDPATGADRHLALSLSPGGQKLFGVSRVEFWLDTGRRQIRKMRTWYLPRNEEENPMGHIVYVDITINRLEANYTGKKMDKAVAQLFMRGSKELNTNWAGYRLVDNRYRPNRQELKQIERKGSSQ